MGNCLAGGAGGGAIIENSDGNEQDYHNRYIEDRVLGEGEFGVVKLVHDMRESDEAKNTMACKTLRKGVVFKDNTIYTPLKTEILVGEVEILRSLNGEHFCMGLNGVYETARIIYLVTEFCAGGEMMEYLSKQEEDLRTDDVSRIAFQLLDAVNHCAQHDVIHRDIKPENVMFKDTTPGSDLRLIDFGSGTNRPVEGLHTTFAGSAFYISPEMFQRTYSQKTDVWSAGVTLYVVVAGYPADVLQKAFNKLQSSDRNLRDLPNLPDNMPDSFYDLLDGLLIYKHKNRKSAGEMLDHEFVTFHKHALSVEQIAMQAQEDVVGEEMPGSTKRRKERTRSVALRGSVSRHTLFLDYQNYQRSLTTLLATLIDKKDLKELMKEIGSAASAEKKEDEQSLLPKLETKLDVIHIRNLKALLKKLKHDQVLAMIDKLPASSSYDSFAYEMALLDDFIQDGDGGNGNQPITSSLRQPGRKQRRATGLNNSLRVGSSLRGSRGASRFSLSAKKTQKDDVNSSIHSAGSLRGRNNFARAASARA